VNILNTRLSPNHSEYVCWDLMNTNDIEVGSFKGWVGWWGTESIEIKENHVPHGTHCVLNMRIYSQTILNELLS
jgi:hypothetical protein